MSYMEQLRALKSEKLLPDEPTKPTKPSFDGFVGEPSRHVSENSPSLPPNIAAGLERLKAEPGPKISNPAVWAEIVADAHRLADEGWASQALALGWRPSELWGASPAVGGDPYLDGLAVWLAGRRIVLIDERAAIAAAEGKRSTFTRLRQKGAVYLWDLFGIQRERNRSGVRK